MATPQQIREAVEYAKKNPDSEFARNLRQKIESGDQQIIKDMESAGYSGVKKVAGGSSVTPSVTAPAEKKPGLAKRIGGALISSEKGLASNIASAVGPTVYGSKDVVASGQDSGKLIEMALKLPRGNPRRTELLKMAAQTAGNAQGQATQALASVPSTKEVLGNSLGVAADILSAGTYGVAAKGAQAGKLLVTGSKSAKAATALGKVGIGATKAGEEVTRKAIIEGAKTPAQAFLKGAVQGAKVAAPVGVAYGVSGALQENKDFKEVLSSGLKGGVLNAALGGLIGGFSARKTFNAPIKAEKLKEKAIQQYKMGLGATKDKYKETADKIIPDLLDSKTWGTRSSLIKKAEQGIAMSNEEYRKLGELSGIASTEGILGQIDTQMKSLMAGDRVISVNTSKYKALQELRDDILSLKVMDEVGNPVTFQQQLRELAQQYGDVLYEGRKSIKTIEDSQKLAPVRNVDSAIRELLNTSNPDYAKINKLYTASSRLADVLAETMKRESSGLGVGRLAKVLGSSAFGAGGLALGGAPGGILSTAASAGFLTMINSTWWNTWRAVQKNNLAEKLLKLPEKQRNQVLIMIGRQGAKFANSLLNRND